MYSRQQLNNTHLLCFRQQKGIPLPVTPKKPWSMDANLMHIRCVYSTTMFGFKGPERGGERRVMPWGKGGGRGVKSHLNPIFPVLNPFFITSFNDPNNRHSTLLLSVIKPRSTCKPSFIKASSRCTVSPL